MRQAVDAFLERGRARELAATTLERYEHHLWRLLGLPENANRPLRWVVDRGAELYAASAYGASDTHIGGLIVGRSWGAWCVKQRMLKANPFENVETVGRRKHGSSKPRLSIDECRKLEAFCFEHADEPDCVLTYAYLMLGKRASEPINARVRDLDDDGRLLRITKAKSTASVKAVALPPELREMLRELAKDKLPDAFLFVQGDGEQMSRYTARDRVKAVLKRAGVTVLPPQALRRTFTDVASMQGHSLRAIGEMVGHTSTAVTARSYASPEAVDGARTERAFAVINGGRR